jgi:hypothetical protein
MTGRTSIYPIVEKFLNDKYARLENAQITPWAFFHGIGLKVNDFHGKRISYSGIRFCGSPVLVFWNGYIEPFLEDIAFRAIDLSMEAAASRNIPLRQPLLEVQGQLYGLCRRTFDRMANIDQGLRKTGVLHNVPIRGTEKELARMRQFIDQRIDAELRAISTPAAPGTWKILNLWFKDHPIVPWLVGLAFAVFGACKALGLF